MPRWLLPAALFVSMALNVFVVGAFVGVHLAGGKLPAQAAQPRPRNPVAAAVRELTPDEQAAWRAQMPSFAQTYGPKVREARQLVRQSMLGFGDPAFDPTATLANLQRARAVEQASRAELDRRLVTFAATLPAADRARFGEALARPVSGGGRAGGGQALPNR
ncbi:periplasmic heavy metal sensor [Phenylobacterium sp.]|uniref:periplasmic heavy metal sensor n=1 Tax=Phenylobacterium sp. TaxID=1871053 RepID=UPI0025CE643F|nr:periplasmic heavy metal sensor [Phenylobacterium sp.]